MAESFELIRGKTPLLVSVPHAGTRLPRGFARRLTPPAVGLPDTDWFVDRLYAGATRLGAGLLVAAYSRYVVDLNRPPDDSPLYPQATPGLVPLRTFSGEPVYRGPCPDATEIAARVESHWRPFHVALEKELARLREEHGFAVLFDAHSIRSRVPGLFEGRLPDLNLGTNGGLSADASLIRRVRRVFEGQDRLSHVVDGRFRGGYITRHYGRPGQSQHALQLEMAQAAYMLEDPPGYNREMAKPVQRMLDGLLARIADWKPGDE